LAYVTTYTDTPGSAKSGMHSLVRPFGMKSSEQHMRSQLTEQMPAQFSSRLTGPANYVNI